jgi:hypothetical protein
MESTWTGPHDDIDATGQMYATGQSYSKKTTANRNLTQKIEAILSSYELQEKYSTKLTPYSLIVIEKLIKTKPEFFRMVESTLVRNVNANIIQANDVPYLISIVNQLYHLLLASAIDNSKYNELPASTCSYILKFVFSVVIREHIVVIEDDTKATLLLLCCDNIVDSCTLLLNAARPVVPEKEPVYVHRYAPVPEPTTVIMPAKKRGCCG